MGQYRTWPAFVILAGQDGVSVVARDRGSVQHDTNAIFLGGDAEVGASSSATSSRTIISRTTDYRGRRRSSINSGAWESNVGNLVRNNWIRGADLYPSPMTDFAEGVEGQEILVVVRGNPLTIVGGVNFRLSGGAPSSARTERRSPSCGSAHLGTRPAGPPDCCRSIDATGRGTTPALVSWCARRTVARCRAQKRRTFRMHAITLDKACGLRCRIRAARATLDGGAAIRRRRGHVRSAGAGHPRTGRAGDVSRLPRLVTRTSRPRKRTRPKPAKPSTAARRMASAGA